jgi:murein DD-endopeptidase MepM/ murein hydrolase activator NlpD
MARRMSGRLRLLLGAAALPLALFTVLPLVSSGAPKNLGSKIQRKQDQIQWRKGREHVLSSDISGFTHKINALQGEITTLQNKQVRLQANLDTKRAELVKIQADLRRERLRLARLRARLAEARAALAKRLLDLYKADQPDLVTVVLESNGFADLLERTEFMQRISHQDAHIIDVVRTAQADATATAARLDALEKRAARVTKEIQGRRDQVSAVRVGLVDRRDTVQSVRSRKFALLRSSQDRRHQLQDDVASLVSAQRKIQAKLAGLGSGSLTAGPVKQGSGGLIWPVNGPITSPFCERRAWEACHPGIDIGVASGTPIRAAAAGKVVLMQPESASGGYGNFTCIQHTASLSTCYAHQSRFATMVGASVSQGQVIGYSGCTGRCFGPHLHFETRVNGHVVNPMNYL